MLAYKQKSQTPNTKGKLYCFPIKVQISRLYNKDFKIFFTLPFYLQLKDLTTSKLSSTSLVKF